MRTGHVSGEQGKIAGYRGSDGSTGFVGRDENNLYAGKDGNVYRRNEEGWQKYDGGDWSPVEKSIDRDAAKQRYEGRSSQLSSTDMQQARQQWEGRSSDRSNRSSSYDRSSTYNQLNRDYSNRYQGQRNYDRTQSWRSSGGYNRSSFSSGSFSRGSYGGRRR